MIVCQRCGKENQDHYKFCLGCGAEIPPARQSVGMMNTMIADPEPEAKYSHPNPNPNPLPGLATPPNEGRNSPPAVAPMGMPAPAAVAHMGHSSGGHSSGGHSSGGHSSGGHGGSSGRAPSAAHQVPAGPPPGVGAPVASAAKICKQCGTEVPSNFKFCGVCGTMIDAEVAPVSQPLQATLTLIQPDGSEGASHRLMDGENTIGRDHGDLFVADGYLSPTHALLEVGREYSVIHDLESLNGVFVRMTEEEELQHDQIIRIGQELLRFELIPAPALTDDGTEIMGSPNPGYWGRLTVLIGDNLSGGAYPLLGDSITIGREHGDINFPDDGYVSGLHARIIARDNKVFLSDMGSSNGTFVKVRGKRTLPNNSYILLGQQLFRLTVA